METTVNGKFDSFDKLRAGKLTAGKADSWRRRIDDQRVSGQSIRAWCRANDAREHSFYWWRRRLCLPQRRLSLPRARPGRTASKQRPVKQAGTEPTANAFAQVILSAAAEPLRLRLAGQTRGEACVRELILPASMPLEQVAKLIHCIEGGGQACRGTT